MLTNHAFDIPKALVSRYSHIASAAHDDVLFCPDNGVTQADYANALSGVGRKNGQPLSLYVHLPFCPVRCLNCNNNTVVTHEPARIDRYLDALEREMRLMTETVGKGTRVQQLHLGGGSPNYLSDRQFVRLMTMLDEHFGIDDTSETSLDANPRRCSPSQLALLHGLGFDRIYFGLRDLDPAVQLAIGRTSSLDMIRDVFDTARDVGFKSIGTDILYGLPSQSREGIERTVNGLLSLSPDRISCIPFNRRAAQRAHQRAIDQSRLPSLADKLALFNSIVEGLSDEYQWISLDSFAKHDDELSKAQSERRLQKNWIGYSHLPASDLYGVGTNAISELQSLCVQNHLEVEPWERAVDGRQFPIRGGVRLNARCQRRRDAIRNLMCNMELDDCAALFDDDQPAADAWRGYARDGLLAAQGAGMRVTPQGRYLLPHLLAAG